MQNHKPKTRAQEIFGREFGNLNVINERPAQLRSDDPETDKKMFAQYRIIRRSQCKLIKSILR